MSPAAKNVLNDLLNLSEDDRVEIMEAMMKTMPGHEEITEMMGELFSVMEKELTEMGELDLAESLPQLGLHDPSPKKNKRKK